MRTAQDKVPQRQLTYQLALAIDTAMLGEKLGQTADREVNELIDANPRSSFSTHVLHNLGARRRRWLEGHARARRASAKSS